MKKASLIAEDVSLKYPIVGSGLSALKSSLSMLTGIGKIKHYQALTDVSLRFNEGEVVGIIGVNGSGKSTLLRVLGGIYNPSSGRVLSKYKTLLLAGTGTGFSPDLTGRQNIYLYGSILGQSKSKMDSCIQEIIEFSGLGEFIELPIKTYSTGMKARLGFAVATSIEPDILLIDEVLRVGDAKFTDKSVKRIRKIVDGAKTVVIVSHSLGFLRNACDRLILMNSGKVVAEGDPDEVIQHYKEDTYKQKLDHRYSGHFEGMDGEYLVGWAHDLQNPKSSVTISILYNHEHISESLANVNRPELAKRFPDNQNLGFRVKLPERHCDGIKRRYYVKVGDAGFNLFESPRDVWLEE